MKPAGWPDGKGADGCQLHENGRTRHGSRHGIEPDAREEKRAVTAFTQRILGDRGLGPDACDFVFGNPQEPPLRGLVEALIRHAEPRDVHWFGYKKYDPAAREAVARVATPKR